MYYKNCVCVKDQNNLYFRWEKIHFAITRWESSHNSIFSFTIQNLLSDVSKETPFKNFTITSLKYAHAHNHKCLQEPCCELPALELKEHEHERNHSHWT